MRRVAVALWNSLAVVDTEATTLEASDMSTQQQDDEHDDS
jgi:hypothetical protein